MPEARLTVEGHGIVDHRVDPLRREACAQRVAPVRHADHVLVVDVAIRKARRSRRRYAFHLQAPVVVRGARPAGLVPAVQEGELGAEHGRLQRVDLEVPADARVVVRGMGAVVAELTHRRGPVRVAGHHETAVAHGAEVLGRVEGVAPERARGARRPSRTAGAVAVAVVGATACAGSAADDGAALTRAAAGDGATVRTRAAPGAERLRGVLDDRDAVRRGERQDRIQFGALPEKVDRDDRLDALTLLAVTVPPGDQGARVEVERSRIDVDEDRRRAEARHDTGRGEERVGRGEHEVAAADLQRHERDEQRVGARGDRDGVVDLQVVGHRRLEGVDHRAADVASGPDDVEDRPLHGGPGRLELGRQIEERDAHRQSPSRIAIGMNTIPLTVRSGPVWRKPSLSYAATP